MPWPTLTLSLYVDEPAHIETLSKSLQVLQVQIHYSSKSLAYSYIFTFKLFFVILCDRHDHSLLVESSRLIQRNFKCNFDFIIILSLRVTFSSYQAFSRLCWKYLEKPRKHTDKKAGFQSWYAYSRTLYPESRNPQTNCRFSLCPHATSILSLFFL